MTYFCFLDSVDATSTYMQPLDADTRDEAIEEAQVLLAEHRSQAAARVYHGDNLIASLPAQGQ
ncbi:hypothetical protein [Brevundimonas sp.]|uniref:hypothetical protein n=1 Tax=Brevundimonas sp. TaxID=1871086 RepID=UPI0037BF9E37